MPTILIIGASRGIGHELARQYRADGWEVLGSVRDQAALDRLTALGAHGFLLEATDSNAPDALARRLEGLSLDIGFVNAGIYGPRTEGLVPPAQDDFDAVMRTNVMAPMRLAPVLAPALARAKGKLAVTSSRMGSIGTRTASAGWLYRASKAALNSALKDISLALGPQGVTCVSFHPGWVRTDMGGSGADLDVKDSVAGMRHTLARLKPAQNGSFLNYDGSDIAW